jgi:DNA recombination-mediator protein A
MNPDLSKTLACIAAGQPIALVGARDATEEARWLFFDLGAFVASHKGMVVTGLADGIDGAAVAGASFVDPARVLAFTPWAGFGAANFQPGIMALVNVVTERQQSLVRELHPAPHALKLAAFQLHCRNVAIMDASKACIAWPSERTGGTRMAMAIARRIGLPVVDLSDEAVREELRREMMER